MKTIKTKLGLSVAFFAALCWLIAYTGYTPLLLLVGYILLRETDQQLRHIGVKALLLTICFTIAGMVVSVIPSLFRFFSNLIGLFGGHFYPEFLYNGKDVLQSLLDFGQLCMTILLFIMALLGKDMPLGPLDKLADSLRCMVQKNVSASCSDVVANTSSRSTYADYSAHRDTGVTSFTAPTTNGENHNSVPGSSQSFSPQSRGIGDVQDVSNT